LQVLDIEGGDGHWSLVSRLMLANEVLDAADAAGTAAEPHKRGTTCTLLCNALQKLNLTSRMPSYCPGC
jgi:hypothetical protein